MIDTITGVLADVPVEHRESAEANLLTFAEEAGHKQVAALGARILAHLNPDGVEPDDTEPVAPARELFLRRKRSGVWELSGRCDDVTGTRASELLDALAERRTGDEGPDFRTLPQRFGDAFSDAVDLALGAHHHRLLHRSGWEVRIAADGLPEFLPPVFIARSRKPRRNNLHEPLPFAA
jgi:hypothetical protein